MLATQELPRTWSAPMGKTQLPGSWHMVCHPWKPNLQEPVHSSVQNVQGSMLSRGIKTIHAMPCVSLQDTWRRRDTSSPFISMDLSITCWDHMGVQRGRTGVGRDLWLSPPIVMASPLTKQPQVLLLVIQWGAYILELKYWIQVTRALLWQLHGCG